MHAVHRRNTCNTMRQVLDLLIKIYKAFLKSGGAEPDPYDDAQVQRLLDIAGCADVSPPSMRKSPMAHGPWPTTHSRPPSPPPLHPAV